MKSNTLKYNIFEDKIFDQYMKEVKKYQYLDKQAERQLIEQMSEGNIGARNKLICSYLNTVIKIAKNQKWSNIPLKELVAAGNLGLVMAAERFDSTYTNGFYAYAIKYIENEIRKCVDTELKRQKQYIENDVTTSLGNTMCDKRAGQPDWNLRFETTIQSIRQESSKGFFEEAGDLFADYILLKLEGYGIPEVAKKYGLTERRATDLIHEIGKTYNLKMRLAA